MQKFFYAVYDEKSTLYSNPFTAINASVALRSFAAAAADPHSEISKFPTDFTLYEIASFQDETGVITPHSQLVNLGKATQFQGE